VRIVVVGGSSSNVGKTTLAYRLLRTTPRGERWCALKVSVYEGDRPTTILVRQPGDGDPRHADSGRLLAAGACTVVWVTVWRSRVRSGLAAGLRAVRACAPDGVVIESTSAGIELRHIHESWFVAGRQPWKPWAVRHLRRADHVINSRRGPALHTVHEQQTLGKERWNDRPRQ
jgi:molybdopterin-guanine dinucleotide biosynthesis protein